MLRPVALSALLLTALVAGCADSPGTDGSEDQPAAFNEVEVTDTTGAIRGIVVSEAVVPIPDVVVKLTDGSNQTTDAEGAFVFNGLEPGDYFLTATKAGYISQQQSATVVAGEKTPPITKVMLPVDQAARPFTEILPWTAFLQCGAYVVAGSVNPCFLTGSDNVHSFEFGSSGRIPDYVLLEAIWDGTQPLGNNLWIMTLEENRETREANGPSPLVVNATKQNIIDAHGNDTESIGVRLFPGVASDGTPTVVTNQRYEIYVTFFYGFTPRPGYSLAVDGPCDVPEKCS